MVTWSGTERPLCHAVVGRLPTLFMSSAGWSTPKAFDDAWVHNQRTARHPRHDVAGERSHYLFYWRHVTGRHRRCLRPIKARTSLFKLMLDKTCAGSCAR